MCASTGRELLPETIISVTSIKKSKCKICFENWNSSFTNLEIRIKMDILFTLLNVQWRTIKLMHTNKILNEQIDKHKSKRYPFPHLSSTQQNIHYKIPFKLYSFTMTSSFKWNVLDGIDKIHSFFFSTAQTHDH